MNKKALSIIIPVYNVETYLEQCVKSILDQSAPEVEVILVDDGSTDNSGKLCDELAVRFSDVKVLHQKNAGAAAARNTGLRKAEGEYIAFVDADDFIGKNSIQKLLEWITKNTADICFARALKYFPDGQTEYLDAEISEERVNSDKDHAVEYLSGLNKYPGSAWGKLFRKQFLKDNELLFPEDRSTGEDLKFVFQCIMKAQTMDSIQVDLYYYRQQRENSATSVISKKSFDGLRKFVEETVNELTVGKMPKGQVEKYALSFAAYEYSIMIWQYGLLKNEDQIAAYDFLKQYQWVQEYGKSRKLHFVKKVTDIFGIRLTSAAMKIYIRLRK